jgi:hypothetical protein
LSDAASRVSGSTTNAVLCIISHIEDHHPLDDGAGRNRPGHVGDEQKMRTMVRRRSGAIGCVDTARGLRAIMSPMDPRA